MSALAVDLTIENQRRRAEQARLVLTLGVLEDAEHDLATALARNRSEQAKTRAGLDKFQEDRRLVIEHFETKGLLKVAAAGGSQ